MTRFGCGSGVKQSYQQTRMSYHLWQMTYGMILLLYCSDDCAKNGFRNNSALCEEKRTVFVTCI